MYDDDRKYFDPYSIPQWFWDVVDKGGKNEEKMYSVIRTLTLEEIRLFEAEFFEVAGSLKMKPFEDYIDENVSEDGIEDISWWVVSQGKTYYFDIWEHPEKIPRDRDDCIHNTFYGIPFAVYKEKGGDFKIFYS